MLSTVEHLRDVLLVLGLLGLSFGSGKRLLSVVGLNLTRHLEDITFATALGAGLISTSILLASFLASPSLTTLLVVLLVWAAVSIPSLRRLPTVICGAFSELMRASFPWAVGLFVAIAVAMILQGLAPPVDWDSLMYHLEVPRQFLEAKSLYVPPDNLHAAFVGLVHFLYLPLLALGGPAAPALLSVAFAILLALAATSYAHRFLSDGPVGVMVALIWGTTTFVFVAVTPRVDVTLTLYLFLAHFALIVGLQERSKGFFLLAAALLGFGFAVKYTAMLYAAALTPFIVLGCRGLTPRQRTLRNLGLFVGTALLFSLPWLVKNLLLFENPVYPLVGGRILPFWFGELVGNQPIALSSDVYGLASQAREGVNLLDLFISPGRLTIESEGLFYFTNPLLLLLPLLLLFFRDRVLVATAVPALAYLAMVTLPFPTTNLRYLLPAIPALTAATIEAAWRVGRRFVAKGMLSSILVPLTMFCLLPTGFGIAFWFSQLKTLDYVLDRASRHEYLSTNPISNSSAYMDMVDYVNENLARDARVLMLLEARGFYFERQTIQDNLLTNWPMLHAWLGDDGCLRTETATHVLLSTVAVASYGRRGMDLDLLRWQSFPSFADRCLEQVHASYGLILFKVRLEETSDALRGITLPNGPIETM